MKNKKNILTIASCFLAIAITTAVITYKISSTKVAYIDTEEVYNEFLLKKDLEKKFQNTQLQRQSFLDSLKVRIQVLSKHLQSPGIKAIEKEETISKLEFLRQDYFNKEKTFAEDNDALTQKYSGEIWKQLNQYIKDFGLENKYEFVLGTTGNGNVMYASLDNNITKQIKEYVNARFEGKK